MAKIGRHLYVPYSMNLSVKSQRILEENGIPFRIIKYNRIMHWVVFNCPEDYHEAREVLGLEPKETYWLDLQEKNCPIFYTTESETGLLFQGITVV